MFTFIQFQGQETALFLADPNFAQRVETSYTIETRIEAGLSRLENRRPLHEALRMRITVGYDLEREAAARLHAVLGRLLTQPIAMPLWPDLLAVAEWGDRIHEAEFVVNMSDDRSAHAVYHRSQIPAVPPHPWLAPLIVGRLDKRPQFSGITDQAASVSFTLVEASPWDCRIAPAAQAWAHGWSAEMIAAAGRVAAAGGSQSATANAADVDRWWPAAIAPDFSTKPKDFTDTITTYRAVGHGRLQAVEGEEGGVRRGQEVLFTLEDRPMVRAVLGHFLARRARTQSFCVPWALFPHEAIDAGNPDQYPAARVRYASDTLTLKWLTFEAARTTIKFTALPLEPSGGPFLAVPDDPGSLEVPAQPSIAHLYRFTLAVPVGTHPRWHYTDYERPLTHDSATYATATIEHDKITQDAELGDYPVTLTADATAGHPWLRVIDGNLPGPLNVEIFRCDPAAPAIAPALLFAGEIIEVKTKGRALTAKASLFGKLLDTKLPRFTVQSTCNHDFCGPWCRASAAAWTWTAKVGAIGESHVDLLDSTWSKAVPSPLGASHDFWSRAAIWTGSGETYDVRDVIRSEKVTLAGGAATRLRLRAPFRALAVGADVSIRVHCGGSWAECETKFANTINFGGHRHVQAENPSLPTRSASATGGKK
ncbi:Uncharacterized conserved protein (DUF2163) [Opitutaceae bacterium TAV1]|nr:Uncharacterized conserved protein (DUF2163) [Opitutaceae bacterium TAV1]